MDLRGLSLIGPAAGNPGGRAFHSFNRMDGASLEPDYVSATLAEADQAVELADAAFDDFSRRPGKERGELLRRIATGIEALGPVLVERAAKESALPSGRIEGERARTCFQLRLFADVAESGTWTDARVDHGDPSRKPAPKPDVRSLLRPIGPVVVFGASNFPLAFSVAGGDTASALAVGCPVVVKAHAAHPGTSELIGRVIQEAVASLGLPSGVFSLLFDEGIEIGGALVAHPKIKAATFTGSRAGGLALWRIAMGRPEPIPFFGELSSVNPVFLFPGALQGKPGAIAEGLHASITLGVGQFCTQPGLVFLVTDAPGKAFIERLSERVRTTPVCTMLTPGIRANFERTLASHLEEAGAATLVPAGSPAGRPTAAALLQVSREAFLRSTLLAEEVFGPSSLVITCDSVQDFTACAEHLEGQLTATVWGEPAELAAQRPLLALLERKAGRLIVNQFPTGVEVGPAMMHGGPFPATTDSRFTSVGTRAIERFLRPVAYQNFPEDLLPAPLR